MYGVIVLLRDHVDMSLKDDSLHVLTSRSGWLADNNVADLILDGLKSMLLSPVAHIFHRKFFVLRRTRNLCQRVKILPHYLWIEFFYCHNLLKYI